MTRMTLTLATLALVTGPSWHAAAQDRSGPAAATDLVSYEETVADQQKDQQQERQRQLGEEMHDLYEEATEDLDEGRLDTAIQRFEQVAARKGHLSDASLYWKAYALYKRALTSDALQTIERLKREHAESRWLKEAQALEIEIRQRGGKKPKLEGIDDDELKIMALSGLMHGNPDEALPLLEKLLEGAHSPKVREHALFVLSQSGSPKALEILARIARGQGSPALERKAIQYLGIHGGPESRKVLAEVYSQTSDPNTKRNVLEAFMICGDKERLLQAFRTEKDLELRAQAVRFLGAAGANAEMAGLYAGETSEEIKQAILEGLMMTNNKTAVLGIARSEKDEKLRRHAVQLLGAMDAAAELEQLYATEASVEVKQAILEGLMVANEAKLLIRIAREEKNPTLRKKAVEMLSVMSSPEARQYLREFLE